MAKNKARPRSQQNTMPEAAANAPAFDRRSLEKALADVGRLLQEREFASVEDANAFLQQMLASGKPLAAPARTPLDKAQELMYQAWEATGRRRVELARKALEVSPDCADCYVLLAEETARSLEQARDLYEQGMKAGERALGPRAFKEGRGDFWGILETRPYMRARAGLAQTLWALGERQQAIAHLKDMLRLNPNDNQGLRYILVNWLLAEEANDDAQKLLKKYRGDISATWAYSKALLAFRRAGAGPEADSTLQQALSVNRFAPAYLLGRKKLPRHLPDYVGFGDENEAVSYAAEALQLWRSTPGALEWLASKAART